MLPPVSCVIAATCVDVSVPENSSSCPLDVRGVKCTYVTVNEVKQCLQIKIVSYHRWQPRQ